MAEKQTPTAEEQTQDSKSDNSKAETPQSATSVSRTPDGRWQSTLSVSFQVTSTWEPADPEGGSSNKESDGETGTGGGTKAGVGAELKLGGDAGNRQLDEGTKTALGAEETSGA